jgi:glycosyltransferase involved in cell wall biosynthesis
MKVAVIPTIRDYPWGAPGHCMGELVRALLAARHDVLWLVAPIDWQNPEVTKLAAAGANVKVLPDPPLNYIRAKSLRLALHRLRGIKTAAELLNDFCPDHVFLNQGGTWCGTRDEFSSCLKPGRYSLICHLNQPQPAFSDWQRRRAQEFMGTAKYVFFNSVWTRQLAEDQLAERIRSAQFFQYPLRDKTDAPLPWPNNAVPQFAMVNRLDTYHKGLDVAFRAFAILKAEEREFTVQLYGEGADEEYLRALATYLNLNNIVQFCGYTTDLCSVWSRAEMLVLPSRFEGLGVNMIEAMAFGRPVLRTAYGGATEWIEDGVNGYSCSAAEVDLLCDTLRRAFAERACWKEMGLRAHDKVRRELSRNPAGIFLRSLDE